jgi:hypothetical protein
MQVVELIPDVWFSDDFKEAVPGEKSDLQAVGREAKGTKAANPGSRTPSSPSHGMVSSQP